MINESVTPNGTPLDVPLTLVQRDAAGNFAANIITATIHGTITGTIPASQVTAGAFGAGAYTVPGSLTIAQGIIAALAPGFSQTVTWNNAAVAFVAQDLNVTDTASNAASLLAQWRVGGVSKLSLAKSGILTAASALVSGASVSAGASASLAIVGKSQWLSSADGLWRALNNGSTGFTRLTLGPETNAFPCLKVNGAGLTIIAGDNATAATLGVTGAVGIGGPATATSKLNVTGLPTAAAGLVAGDVWNNLGILNIV